MAVFRRRQFSAEKGICHMHDDTITRLPDPSGFAADALTEVIRAGARKLIEQAIEAEMAALLATFSDEKLGDGRAAVADLERMLAAREKSYGNGSYNRPRMGAAMFRIGVLQRDALNDPAAARKAFHRLYAEHDSSILRPRALFEEAKLAQAAGDAKDACALADRLLAEFEESRFARTADQVCPAVSPRAEALRKRRAEARAKGKPVKDDD